MINSPYIIMHIRLTLSTGYAVYFYFFHGLGLFCSKEVDFLAIMLDLTQRCWIESFLSFLISLYFSACLSSVCKSLKNNKTVLCVCVCESVCVCLAWWTWYSCCFSMTFPSDVTFVKLGRRIYYSVCKNQLLRFQINLGIHYAWLLALVILHNTVS